MMSALLVAKLLLAFNDSVPEPLVPWYVPRSVSLGVFWNSPMVAPHFRVAWEGIIIAQPRNELVWVFTGGSAVGLGTPSPMTEHYQHTLLAGAGFRSDRETFHWGFHVVAGPLWYRTAYLPGSGYRFENRVLGSIEGRLQAGIRLMPHFRLSAYVGYSSPFVFQRQFPGNTYVGGFDFGLVAGWR